VDIRAIVTIPPYAPFAEEVARHPIVAGLRLNTVMPIAGPLEPVLQRLAGLGAPLWVDLKGRQLRVVGAAMPPFTEVRVSHAVRVNVPATAFFNDGREPARVVAIEGDRLILEDGPRRLVGPGESINVVDPSLEILGTLTDTDRRYLAAMRDLGLRRVMLSFAEREADAAEVEALLPGAEVILKIESPRGIDLARRLAASPPPRPRLMAARGDLYVEVLRPHRIVSAMRQVIAADPGAIAASRVFTSLSRGEVPDCADIGDVAFLMSLGYRTFMLGDEVCLARESVMSALNLLEAVAAEVG
jgi:pyruvate kinase